MDGGKSQFDCLKPKWLINKKIQGLKMQSFVHLNPVNENLTIKTSHVKMQNLNFMPAKSCDSPPLLLLFLTHFLMTELSETTFNILFMSGYIILRLPKELFYFVEPFCLLLSSFPVKKKITSNQLFLSSFP